MLVLALVLLPPVAGGALHGFEGGDDPFARGLRRAVVLSARAGEAVRAPCTGRVGFSGATPRGPALTLRCRGRRVTVMPVRAAVRRGARVPRAARVGSALGDVSVSVREPDGAYVAPRFSRAVGAPPPPVPARRPRRVPRPGPPAASPFVPPLPWSAWAGVALVVAAALRLRAREPGSEARKAARRGVSAAISLRASRFSPRRPS